MARDAKGRFMKGHVEPGAHRFTREERSRGYHNALASGHHWLYRALRKRYRSAGNWYGNKATPGPVPKNEYEPPEQEF